MRATALCDQTVRVEDLPERVRRHAKPPETESAVTSPPEPDDEVLLPLSEIERRHILLVLSRTHGNKQAAARILGIDRTTLQRKLERYDLENTGPTGDNGKQQRLTGFR